MMAIKDFPDKVLRAQGWNSLLIFKQVNKKWPVNMCIKAEIIHKKGKVVGPDEQALVEEAEKNLLCCPVNTSEAGGLYNH